MTNQTNKPKPPLPDYHRGYVTGILDAKDLLERLSKGVVPTEGLDMNGTIKLRDAIDLFQEQLGNMAQAMQVKADTARDIAQKLMLSPLAGGHA
jgi:hypothetical protein